MNKNNYVIISSDKITIDTEIKKICNTINSDDLEIIKYEYPDAEISTVLENLNTYNFLSKCKLVIFNNCTFLSKEQDKDIKKIGKYLDSSSDNYFIMVNESLSDKKEIKELLSKNVEVINKEISSENLIKNSLDFCKMDNRTIKYFADYCLHNNEKILNELEKIKCYKYTENDKNISIEDINNIVMRDYDEDIFDLVNAIVAKNRDKSLALYRRISRKEKDSVNIIASVAGGIRNLYSVKTLLERKFSQSEISNILGIKPYAVSVASNNCNNFSSKKLLSLLNMLSDIDFKTKSGSGHSNTLFEIFLLSL